MIPTIQRKFTRKKHRPPPPVAIATKSYEAHLTPEERYRRHFAMWEFWHAEILEGLSDSRKKALRATEESLVELIILQSLLWSEKGEKLTPHLTALERLRNELDKDLVSGQAFYRWRATLERQGRDIHREFAWKQVEDYLMPPPQE